MKLKKQYYYATIFLTLLVFLAIFITDTHLINKLSKGIVSFELARDFQSSQAILQSWNIKSRLFASFSLGIDFLFILLYTLFFVLTIQRMKPNNLLARFKKIMIGVFILAGLFDLLENYFLLQILTGNLSNSYPVYASFFASMKFSLIVIGALYLIASIFTKKKVGQIR